MFFERENLSFLAWLTERGVGEISCCEVNGICLKVKGNKRLREGVAVIWHSK